MTGRSSKRQPTEPPAPDVAATLRTLLAGSDPVSGALLAQVPHTRVVGRCGCVTVDLEVERAAVAPAPPHLEIYSVSDEPISAWPDPRFIER